MMAGRPTKLDDLVSKRITDAIAKGNTRATAAKLANVAPSTLYEWLRLGREGDARHADFVARVEHAEAEAEDAAIAVVRTAASSGTWQAASWWLEHKYPARWALRPSRFERDTAPPTEAETERLIAEAAELHAAKTRKP